MEQQAEERREVLAHCQRARAEAEEALRATESRRAELTATIEEWRRRIVAAEEEAETARGRLVEMAPDSSEFKKLIRARAEAQSTAQALREQLAAKERQLADLPQLDALAMDVERAALVVAREELRLEAEPLTELLGRQIAPLVEKCRDVSFRALELAQKVREHEERAQPRKEWISQALWHREIDQAVSNFVRVSIWFSADVSVENMARFWNACAMAYEQLTLQERMALRAEREAAQNAIVEAGAVPGTIPWFIKQQGGLRPSKQLAMPPEVEEPQRKEMPPTR